MCLYESEYEVKVSFEDLDPMNIVWHGNYMRYMEQARCDMLEKLHYTYMDIKNDGYAYPVAKMKVKYIKPAQYRDILIVKTMVMSVEPAFDIKYVMYKKSTGEKIFEATTMQIALNINTLETVYQPPENLVKAISKLKG